MPRENRTPTERALARLSDLNRRYNALPIWLIEAQSDAFVQWVDDISSTTEAIQATGSVAPEALENVSMWEHAMNHWERTAAASDGHDGPMADDKGDATMEEPMAKPKKVDESEKPIKTERELTLDKIRDKFRELGDHLSSEALKNVVQTGQESKFSVGIALEPTDDGKVKFAAKGKVMMSTEKYEDVFAIDDQVVIDEATAS
jgi:hypothetical protein